MPFYPFSGALATPDFFPFASGAPPITTLFGQPAAPATLTADPNAYTLGMQFTVSRAVTGLAVWFFTATGAVQLPATIALYNESGPTLVTSNTPVWSQAVGSNLWARAPFTSPPALSAGITYKVCVLATGASNWYATSANYFATSGVSNGPLTAPNNAGASPSQDSFNVGSALAYPATAAVNAPNYWIDIEVQG